MPDSKYFGVPFATSGDRASIPEAAQPSGAISMTQGFGPDYERDPATDPLAKRVPRDETNEYLYQITNALRFLQLYGVPEWYETDGSGNRVSYPLLARVRHAGSAWASVIANNQQTPGATGAAGWVLDEAFSFARFEATVAEVLAGTSADKILTPRRLVSRTATDARIGLVELATVAEFIAGVDAERAVTPNAFAQGIGSYISGAQTILYVRTDGNNANDGGANTAARAFATIQGALDYLMSRFGAGKSVLIQLGTPGVYASPTRYPTLCNIEIAGGAVGDVDSYRFSNAGPARNIISLASGYCLLTNLRLENQHAGLHMADAVVGGHIDVRGVKFGASTTAGGLMRAANGGKVRAIGNCIVGCNARAAMLCLSGGSINVTVGTQIVYEGGPAFSAANIEAANLAIVDIAGGGFSGSASGPRFAVSGNAVINTNGGGVNLLPGSAAGTTATGGLYV